jgi:hypothetical protein
MWEKVEHQRVYLDWIGSQIGVKQREDWYNISKEVQLHFHSNSNNQSLMPYDIKYLSRIYGALPFQIVTAIYTDYIWSPWKFATLPKGNSYFFLK